MKLEDQLRNLPGTKGALFQLPRQHQSTGQGASCTWVAIRGSI